MRLDRFLSTYTEMSRSQARKAVRGGRVIVNRQMVTDYALQLGDDAVVVYDGDIVAPIHNRYFMLNKPLDVVCATKDKQHRTVIDLIAADERSGLHVAGRLDIDTTGLVLLTDDGDWSHQVTSPRKKCPKTYRLELAEDLPVDAVSRLEQGVMLKSEDKPTLPAQVEQLTAREIRLTIHEGRYHQVKRMLAAVGNRVVSLHRERIGAVVLDASLAAGDYRPLTEEEMSSFR